MRYAEASLVDRSLSTKGQREGIPRAFPLLHCKNSQLFENSCIEQSKYIEQW